MFSKLLAPIFILLVACGGGDGFTPVSDEHFGAGGGDGTYTPGESILPPAVVLPETDAGTGIVYGKVIDSVSGAVISGVVVSAANITVTTDVDGAYILANIPYADRVVVNMDATGYSEQSKVVVLTESQHAVILNPLLLPVGTTATFDPTIEQTITSGVASVTLAADSLAFIVDELEQPPVGEVTVNLTNVDASSDPFLMPGDYLDSTGNYIESFGALSVSFTDESENELDLKVGSTASVTIPVASSASTSAPSSTSKFSYSRETGLWTNEGNINQIDGTYSGEVTHFSTWNADEAYTPVTITGCVDNGLEAPLTEPLGGTVVTVRGSNYIGTSSAIVAADGTFQVQAKENSNILITASNQGKISNTIQVATGSGAALQECLSIREFSISVSLTWGANPVDLDTHLVSPDNHIYYINRGSLTSTPFIALDVDDVSGFGPEVLTINKFTVPGVYVYSVYHFSGTGNITNSPTRVELNYNGDTFVFAPPSGQAENRTWNVFQIIVDDDLAVSDIQAVQSWSPSSP